MPSPDDHRDRKLSLALFAGIAATLVIVGAIIFFLTGPAIGAAVAPGLGLRDAALIAFGVTLVTIVILAIAAGDGLLGEIQFMLVGFTAFFVIFWLMLAWIF